MSSPGLRHRQRESRPLLLKFSPTSTEHLSFHQSSLNVRSLRLKETPLSPNDVRAQRLSGGIEDVVVRGQHVWVVRRTLDGLPEQDREMIRLLHHRRLTHTEIAQSLDIPLRDVTPRSDRAHRQLARQLGLQSAGHDLV